MNSTNVQGREIKFRAWDGYKMVYDICVMAGKQWDLLGDRPIEGYPIMQFTGLRDKSGNEIYEGDIIRFKVDFPDQEFDNGVVRFAAGGHWTSQTEDDLEELLSNEISDLEGEVIGNICEHPHLLKSEQNG